MRLEDGQGPARTALCESHMHTRLCRHATGEIEEYAAVAQQRGLAGVIVTCHNPLPDGYSQEARMYEHQWPDYLALVERARQAWAGRVDVRLGLECDYVPGFEAYLQRQAESADFHYLLGSVHPHVREYRVRYGQGDAHAFFATYFEQLAQAAETRLFDCLSHADIVKNVFPAKWHAKRLLPIIEPVLDRIATTGVAMELNTSGRTKEVPEMNPGLPILRQMRRRGIPVVIGSDAHCPEHVGRWWEEAMDLLERAGYSQISYFLGRKRLDVPIALARRTLRPPVSPPIA